MCADPKPVVIAVSLARDRAVTATDFDRVNTALLFKPQRRVSRICLEESEVFVSELLNLFRQVVIALPKRRQRV
jgi:hypothetical protein